MWATDDGVRVRCCVDAELVQLGVEGVKAQYCTWIEFLYARAEPRAFGMRVWCGPGSDDCMQWWCRRDLALEALAMGRADGADIGFCSIGDETLIELRPEDKAPALLRVPRCCFDDFAAGIAAAVAEC